MENPRWKFVRALLLHIVCFSLATSVSFAQSADPSVLTLDRIFKANEFRTQRFGPARWLEEGGAYTTVEKSATTEAGQDIVKYETETGKRKVLVAAAKLLPAGADKPMSIDNYEWSPDKSMLLLFTNTKRVWRRNTRGDYWLVDLKSWKLHKLGGDAAPSTLMFATFSPDGSQVAYVVEHNLYVESVASHAIKQLTTGGSKTIINGTFDWVYEEEFGLRNGFRWSPDSKQIAYWQLDAEGVGEFYMINNTDSIYSQIIPVQYPKVGTTNSACRVGVVQASGGETLWFDVPGDPRNNYIARMEWAANSKEIVLQHINRLQNTNDVMLGDAATGKMKSVYVDKDDAWLDVVDDLKWLAGGEKFTWVSERNGWRHAYMVSRDGSEVRKVTPWQFDVISIQLIDERGGWLYYIASPDNPTQRYLYRSKLNGTGEPERLSPAEQPGTHAYQVSPDAKWAFHTFSNFETPPVVSLVSLPDHKVVRTLVDNAEVKEKLAALKPQPVEFFRVEIEAGVELDGWAIKPPDFDSSAKYPLFFFVYGEPAGQTVLDRWRRNGGLWHRMLAQQGYVVVSVDNRGTPAPRGRDWRKCIYGEIGVLASHDQAAAARKLLATRPYLDASRVGIWGWSGGGSMTLNMLFRHPELYHTGMSVAPVGNQRLYDTIYQERYMGTPQNNPEGFKKGSPFTYAHQLQGNLLLVHGTGDDNVHYQNSEVVINELIKHNKMFSMMAYPNRTHGIREGENTTRHLYGLLTWYLHNHLPAGPVAAGTQ